MADGSYQGWTYVNPATGQGYAISHQEWMHKRVHLWRIDGVTWTSVATFTSIEEAERFRLWLEMPKVMV